MTPLPKRKHTRGRTNRRRQKKALTKNEVLSIASKNRGIIKRLISLNKKVK